MTTSATSSELRPIERLDQERIDRVVVVLRPLMRRHSETSWAIGDALLAEWPILSASEAGRINALRRIDPGHEPLMGLYFQAIAKEIGRSTKTIKFYRWTAAAYSTEERVPDVSFTMHQMVQHRPDRDSLLRSGLTCDQLEKKLYPHKQGRSDRRRSEKMYSSFSNISKAAEAAIEVLADDDLPTDKRVSIALNILVKFFEEAAGA